MAPTRRETRSRTSSPYAGRPESRSRASSQAAPATPRTKQAQQEPSSRHRYGLRSMLSNLIWGSPVKAVEEESESGEDIDTDDDEDDEGLDPLTQDLAKQADVQVISDDDEQKDEQQPQSAASSASSAPRRFTAAEKGKGSPKRTDSYSTTKYLPQHSAFGGGGLRSSQTFGDMRSIQRSVGVDIPTSTPNTSISANKDDPPSPADVNSQLANFFAAKGTASLTADERKKISAILLGGTSSAASADVSVPTALTPNFSFQVPVPSAINASASILSPAYKGLARSNTTSGGLSSLASRATGGLTGSQSLSSLASLANGPGGSGSAAINPRSALNRRQARPLYLGAGYSSQAIARRKRVQAQMGSLYSNLNSFDSPSTNAAGPSVAANPGKRRRVGEDAASSTAFGTGSPARSSSDLANAPPAFSVESPAPLTSTPGPSKASHHPSLFQSAPHLKAQFASTPARPSPLRAAAVATPSPPAKAVHPSPPRTTSKTVDLMRNIVGDTSEPSGVNKSSTSAAISRTEKSAPTPITMTRTSKPTSKVPREELIKRAEPPSAAEILERSMPPELRHTPNGKQVRPKPPPVPGSARKTRAAAAADAEAQKEDKTKAKEQARDNLRVPPARRSKSRSKTPDAPSEASSAETESARSTTTKLTAGQAAPAEKEGIQVDDNTTTNKSAAPTKSAFSFGSGTPPTPAPSFFGKGPSKNAESGNQERSEPKAPTKPPFQFSPATEAPSTKSAFSFTSAPADNSISATPPPPAKAQGAFMEVDSTAATSKTLSPDARAEALKESLVSLPTFTLYEAPFSFSSSAGDEDDAAVKAVKQTVLEMPKNELVVFDLL